MSSETNDYWVYIVTNNTRSTVYIGVTSDLRVRIWQHRAGERPNTFSQRYHCAHLVYFEHYREVHDAIAREKQLKGWRRAKKNTLIATLNPQWRTSPRIGSTPLNRKVERSGKANYEVLRLRSG